MKLKTRTIPATRSLHRNRSIAFTSILSVIAILAMLSSTVIVAAPQPNELDYTAELVDTLESSEITLGNTYDLAPTRWFNGRQVRPARTITMIVTAYSPDAQSCGKFADGITASGYSVKTNGMKLVAADTSQFPFGTKLSIPGYDDSHIVPVLDRGGAIKGNHLDALFPTHQEALQWGVQELDVTIWEYADGLPDDFRAIY